MTETLSHHESEQLLSAAALEMLEREELARVIAHAEECDRCARLLESYRDVVAGLAVTLPVQPLATARSSQIRARLLGRARERSTGPAGSAAQPRKAKFRAVAAQWAGWAVAAGLAGVLLVHHSVHRPVAYGWLVAGALAVVVIALAVYVQRQHVRLSAMRRPVEPDESGEEDQRLPSGW